MPIDVAITAGNIYVALMSKTVKIYDPVGKPLPTQICFDTHIISLVDVTIQNRQLPYCCVATVNGELTFLFREQKADVLKLEEGCSALYFGVVGREPYNLLTISKQGGLFLRTLSRTNTEKGSQKVKHERPDPIPIPKKTQLFLSKIENEKKLAKEMFQKWKNSVRYLYMLSANTYAKILENSVVSPIDDVSFSAKVLGMGPEFVLNVTIVNNGKEAIAAVKVIVKYNPRMYKISPEFVSLPTMVGGYRYTARFELRSIDIDGKADVLNVVAVGPQFPVALCSSIVQVPVSQFPTT
jgi:Bardet-Biedl syndrome 1 protein